MVKKSEPVKRETTTKADIAMKIKEENDRQEETAKRLSALKTELFKSEATEAQSNPMGIRWPGGTVVHLDSEDDANAVAGSREQSFLLLDPQSRKPTGSASSGSA